MMNDSKLCNLWVIIPAAGIGRRMKTEYPKQYLPLNHATVIEHTLAAFFDSDSLNVSQIVVALHSNDHWFDRLSFPFLNTQQRSLIATVIGGDERSDTVLAALQSLKGKADIDDWVLVHDAARPCLRPSSIIDLLSLLDNDPVGGILAVPASDTLKQVDQGQIVNTVSRQAIWHAQTPQCFRYGLITQALQRAHRKDFTVTDEASAIEYLGLKPKVIEGYRDNIKITHPEDLILAEAILYHRSKLVKK